MRKLILIAALILAACSTGQASPTPSSAGISPPYTGLNTAALGQFHATFLMRFEGNTPWSYRLELRSDGQVREFALQLDGLSPSQDPGDIRMVSQEGINRMRGPGTDEECVQFPSQMALGAGFFIPDDLVSPDKISPLLTRRAQESIVGVNATHYSLNQIGVAGWNELQVDLWRDEITGAVLRYDITAVGQDPLYQGGEGTLRGRFVLNTLGPQTIEPIPGCEIDLPLPGAATGLMRLPGLIAFEVPAPIDELVTFYQRELAESGWTPRNDPLAGPEATVLSYSRGEEILEINIERRANGSAVELFLEKE